MPGKILQSNKPYAPYLSYMPNRPKFISLAANMMYTKMDLN
jgi:hypothetical protein